ncbi:acyl-CoA carboxylase subunit epsilon [Microlunatus spumicola]|uniref:acyl-CoA carboxylase subunit epsilon n=1 Tax=Microlunatus spumicola TaxID=81499 RepID=UPI0031E04EBF
MSNAGHDPGDATDGAPVEPLFRVVRGAPTDVELAALSVVLAARTRPVDEPAPPRQGPSAWAASARAGREPGRPGPDAWRRSARG